VPGSIGSAATPASLALSYLNDFQVNLMVQAVEASSDNTLVQAPPRVGDRRPDGRPVSRYQLPIRQQPDADGRRRRIGRLYRHGQHRPVRHFVAGHADSFGGSKYVNLTLTPTLSLPPVITPFNLTTPASNTTTTSGTGTVFTSGSSNAVAETIELVTQNTTAVETQ